MENLGEAATNPSPTDAGGWPLTRREMRRRGVEIGALPGAEASPSPRPVSARGSFTVADLFEAEAPSAPVSDDPRPTILTVCTGNICRSPLGEVLLRARLEPLGVRVHSAGTHALVGHPMTEQAQALAVANGAASTAAEAHGARLLTEQILAESDLVLAMTAEHSTFAVQMLPSRLRFTFPVRLFARLAALLSDVDLRVAAATGGDSPRLRLAAMVWAVSDQRGLAPASAPEDDDVVDPYRKPQEVYDLSAAQLVPALDQVERILRIAMDCEERAS